MKCIKEVKTILVEKEDKLCARIERYYDKYKGVRYEIWYDKNKYKQGITTENGRIYMQGFANIKEQEVLDLFNN